MSFRISGLSPEPFRHLFGLADEALKAHGAIRYVVDKSPGYPERIELRDASVDDTVLLVNYAHLPVNNPYNSRYAIYIREGAQEACSVVDEVPDVLRRRIIALRAFDKDNMLIHADLATGDEIEVLVERLFSDQRAVYLHAHNAKYGCYLARIDRVAE
ncbi:DUF1203 domain-containing protein [Dyella mobilis]|uniref:DUF1203 domain-containing protein n=1 Tax=Dyella mobilis TaxID=1849582 RepID=A0ABS2KBZ9_9GAMM|nr:DUF1203 domain-containing protein [Dyella mobilis]MBM7128715.1 DUF1203 domain-containing protein [Dyella mobilis]GLQ99041.1 hypothetical protein GCM10007863_34610 [Dyella mobilis]